MTQVNSISQLGKWNYYYDTTSEHLYVMLINEQNQKAVTQRWNLTNYNSQGPVITIKAACESCAATKLNVSNYYYFIIHYLLFIIFLFFYFFVKI